MKGLAISNKGVILEGAQSLVDVQDVTTEYGERITVYIRGEENISKDDYNSLIKRTDEDLNFEISAYPVQFSPNTRQGEKAGIFEKCDVIIYTAYKDWTDREFEFKDIEMNRSTVILQNETYIIKDKNRIQQIGEVYLYITLGLSKL